MDNRFADSFPKYEPTINDKELEGIKDSEIYEDGTSIAQLLKTREEPSEIKDLADSVNGSLSDMNAENNKDFEINISEDKKIDQTNTNIILKYIGEMILFVILYLLMSQEPTVRFLEKYIPKDTNVTYAIYGALLYIIFIASCDILRKFNIFPK